MDFRVFCSLRSLANILLSIQYKYGVANTVAGQEEEAFRKTPLSVITCRQLKQATKSVFYARESG